MRRVLAVVCSSLALAAQSPPSFDRDVRPILASKCLACHGPDANQRKAKLRLDVREVAIEKGAIVPGRADTSAMITRIEHTDPDERMPPPAAGVALDTKERATLRAWIEAGADYEPHWAFRAPKRSPLPACATAVHHPIDAFVQAALPAHGLTPAPAASRASLIRRLSLDLLGLPPSPAQVDSFTQSREPDAYERLVDSLLSSPAFGEHMALPWLDAARYADSNGYQHDGDRQAWPWRDWLVNALNANRRFDQVVVEMLAGDLLPDATEDQLVATALQRHHPINNEGGAIADEVRFQYAVDRVHTFSTAFLGLTLGCAQCHDHKYDPFTQRDYYALFALFADPEEDAVPSVHRRHRYHTFQIAQPHVVLGGKAAEASLAQARDNHKAASERLRAFDSQLDRAFAALLADPTDPRIANAPGEIAALIRRHPRAPLTGASWRTTRRWFALHCADEQIAAAQRDLDAAELTLTDAYDHAPAVMVMREPKQPKPTYLHVRGAYDQPTGEPVAPGTPELLGAWPKDAPRNRLGLARWLVSPEHPLFARVVVNRVWQGLFGRGLVATPEDFGATGERPSHPELLDHLAREFIDGEFDLKGLLRHIVTSATYRQSCATSPHHLAVDSNNVWLARSPRYRLASFTLRDQALALGGLLDSRVGGPPVYPYHPAGLWLDVSFEVFDYPRPRAGDAHRRSLYTFWRRTVAPPTLFDAASRQTCVVRPSRTSSPLHALVLLNDPTFVEAARAMASIALREAGDDETRLHALFRRATARAPEAHELAVLTAALHRERGRFAAAPNAATTVLSIGTSAVPADLAAVELAAWSSLAQLVLNLDEVLNRP